MELNESHRWGEENDTPVCLDCRVEGYDDVPAAFAECPGPPRKKPRGAVCWATMDSVYLPGHTHLCELESHAGDHMCAECRRRFGVA